MDTDPLSNVNIALTGAAGIGKSTLAKELATALNKALIDEHYDDQFQRKNIKEKKPEQWARELIAIFRIKTGLEEKHPGFVTDRCALDLMALWCKYGLHVQLDQHHSTQFFQHCQSRLAQYHFIIVPPWGVFDMPQVNPCERPKIRRSLNKFTQMHYHAMLLGYVHLYCNKFRVIEIPRQIMEPNKRTAWVIAEMRRRSAMITARNASADHPHIRLTDI